MLSTETPAALTLPGRAAARCVEGCAVLPGVPMREWVPERTALRAEVTALRAAHALVGTRSGGALHDPHALVATGSGGALHDPHALAPTRSGSALLGRPDQRRAREARSYLILTRALGRRVARRTVLAKG